MINIGKNIKKNEFHYFFKSFSRIPSYILVSRQFLNDFLTNLIEDIQKHFST